MGLVLNIFKLFFINMYRHKPIGNKCPSYLFGPLSEYKKNVHVCLLMKLKWYFDKLSSEIQKSINAVERCSIENQKDAIAIHFV